MRSRPGCGRGIARSATASIASSPHCTRWPGGSGSPRGGGPDSSAADRLRSLPARSARIAPAGEHYLFCGRLIEPYKRITVPRRGLQRAPSTAGDRRRRPRPRRGERRARSTSSSAGQLGDQELVDGDAQLPGRGLSQPRRFRARSGRGDGLREAGARHLPAGARRRPWCPGSPASCSVSQEPDGDRRCRALFRPGSLRPACDSQARGAVGPQPLPRADARLVGEGTTFVYADMRRVIPLLTLLALLVWAAVPVGASAQDNSGLSQYQENPPTAGGGGGGGGHHGGGGGGGGHNGGGGAAGGGSGAAAGSSQSGGGSVSQSTVNQLDSMGADGQAAADAAIASTALARTRTPLLTPLPPATRTRAARARAPRTRAAGGSGGATGENATGGQSGGSGGVGVGDLFGNTVGGSESGGMGPALPIILGIVLLSAVAVLVARRGGFGRLHRG